MSGEPRFVAGIGRSIVPDAFGTIRWKTPVPVGDAVVDTLLFKDGSSRLILSHRLCLRDGLDPPRLVNDLRAIVDYNVAGCVSGFALTMHVIIPGRLGKEFVAGADVSRGAKTFLQFDYDKIGDAFVMREITKGAATRLTLDRAALASVVKFPFPVQDRLEPKGGIYTLQYLVRDGALATFMFNERHERRAGGS